MLWNHLFFLCIFIILSSVVADEKTCPFGGIVVSCPSGECCRYPEKMKTFQSEWDVLLDFKKKCLDGKWIKSIKNWCDGNEPEDPSLCEAGVLTDPCTGEIFEHPFTDDPDYLDMFGELVNQGKWTGIRCKKSANMMRVEKLYFFGKGLECDLNDINLPALKYLKDIDLARNNIYGSIPNYFHELVALHRLDLSDNKLTGTIPPEFSKSYVLQILDISRNPGLYGSIPEEIVEVSNDGTSLIRMLNLKSLRIHQTNIEHLADYPTGLIQN